MCLCGLSDRDLKVAHGELVGMQLLMEDVLSSCHMTMEGPLGWQAIPDKNTQVFLVNSLHNHHVLCCTEEPSYLGNGLENHIVPIASSSWSQDCANVT